MEISVVPDVADVKEDRMRCSKGQKIVPEDSRTQSQKSNFAGQNGLFREKKRRTCCLCCSLKEAVRTWFALRHWRDWLQGDGRGQLVSLLAAAMILIGSGTVVWSAIGGDENANSSWEQSSWMSWGLFFDPGTQTGVSAGAPTKVKATALIFSVLGFLYNLTFLGIIVEWIRSSMDRWSKTKSRIWYGNHILILGWSEKTLYLLNELFEALRSSGDFSVSVVVLAEREVSEMHQEVQQHFYQIWEGLSFFDRRWRLLNSLKLREGITHEGDSLERAGASHAQEIILLSREGDQRNADLETVRVMVALSSLRQPVKCKVFAEVQMHEVETVLRRLHPDPTGTQVIHARAACSHILSLLATDQTVGGMITDLCSFTSGEELYVIQPLPEWQTFGQARKAFDRAVCIGVEATKPVVNAHGTRIDLCPSDDRPMEAQERLLVMASNWADVEAPTSSLFHWRSVDPDFMPSTLVSGEPDVFSKAANARSSSPTPVDAEGARKRVYVVIGWPADFAEVLALLDEKVPPGTEVHVLSERTEPQRIALCAGKGQRKLRNIELQHLVGPRTSRKMLEQLPLEKALDGVDGESQPGAILILAQLASQFMDLSEQIADDDEVGDDTLTCDSACLTSLLVIADILGENCGPRTSTPEACELLEARTYSLEAVSQKKSKIICEVLDPRTERVLWRNENLKKMAYFFRSKALETGIFMMAMSEPAVFNTLMILMSPSCPSLQVRPVQEFLPPRDTVAAFDEDAKEAKTWRELSDTVRKRGGLLVGWKSQNEECQLGKDKQNDWAEGDTLIVILPPQAPKGS
ncbi:unnamed protein product [Cladocopium goreaui]|uniref:Ion channel POLLUX n=1 Tax=Cladocopium goreaui TaxID=2562237 RepID=A0A9P1FI10_9DINO|nr:unnamed protein product [Cladocopium goreaui]